LPSSPVMIGHGTQSMRSGCHT